MSFLLLTYGAIQAGLLIWTFRWSGVPRAGVPRAGVPRAASARLWLLRLMLFGMIYDNLVQGAGQWFMDSATWESINAGRYFLHVVTLPWLTLLALSLLREADVAAASNRVLWSVLGAIVLLALGWGLYHDVAALELEPVTRYGVFKYVSVSKLPPLGTIVTNLVVLVLAALLWRAARWPWLFAGALFIFLLNGATGSQPWGFLVGNFAELVFVGALLATEYRFRLWRA